MTSDSSTSAFCVATWRSAQSESERETCCKRHASSSLGRDRQNIDNNSLPQRCVPGFLPRAFCIGTFNALLRRLYAHVQTSCFRVLTNQQRFAVPSQYTVCQFVLSFYVTLKFHHPCLCPCEPHVTLKPWPACFSSCIVHWRYVLSRMVVELSRVDKCKRTLAWCLQFLLVFCYVTLLSIGACMRTTLLRSSCIAFASCSFSAQIAPLLPPPQARSDGGAFGDNDPPIFSWHPNFIVPRNFFYTVCKHKIKTKSLPT